MNLMDLFIKIGVDDQASSKVGSISKKLGSGLKTAAKIGTAAVAAAGAAVIKLAKDSIESYAEYEQLVGGVETLFKDSAGKVQEYANQAYKTANMSANKYMETVTSFSASLLQGLGNDTAKAAEYADMAVRDMSDNANKFGTDISMIQNAYQGFAKRNYTMLDNLKLGYGGTASEMARLINDSGVLGDTVTVTASNINRVSFDKIVEAINVVQTEMGITGTTAKEASGTISGSVATMKASWENLLTSISNGNNDVTDEFNIFVNSVDTVLTNLKGPIETAKETLKKFASDAANYLSENHDELVDSGFDAATEWVNGMTSYINSEDSIQKIGKFVDDFLNNLVSEENLGEFLTAGNEFAASILDGIIDAVIDVDKTAKFIDNLSNTLEGQNNHEKFAKIGAKIIEKIYDGFYPKPGEEGFIDIIVDVAALGLSNQTKSLKAIGGALWESIINGIKEKSNRSLEQVFYDEILIPVADFFKNLDKLFEAVGLGDLISDELYENLYKKYDDLFGEKTEVYGPPIPPELLIKELLPKNPIESAIESIPDSQKKSENETNGTKQLPAINITINGARYTSEENIAKVIAEELQRVLDERNAAYG